MLKKILALVVLILILLLLLICVLRPNRRNAVSPDEGETLPLEQVVPDEGTTMQSDENTAQELLDSENETISIEPPMEIQESAGDIEMETMFETIITENGDETPADIG